MQVSLPQSQPVMVGGQPIVPQQGGGVVLINDKVQKAAIQLSVYDSSRAKVFGYLQMTMGVLLIIFNMAAAIINYNTLWVISGGWWASPFIITAGALGVASARYKTKKLIKSTLAFSIISLVFVIPLLTQGGLAINNGYDDGGGRNRSAYVAMNSFFLIAALAEIPIALYQCILCCTATCKCCQKIAMIQAQDNFPPGQQQIVYYSTGMATNQQQPQAQHFNQQQQQQNVMTQQQFMQQPMPQQDYIVIGAQGVVGPSDSSLGPQGPESLVSPPSYDDIDNDENWARKVGKV